MESRRAELRTAPQHREAWADPLGLTPDDLAARAGEFGWPRFRGRQIFNALQAQRVQSWDEIAALPQRARQHLAAMAPWSWPVVAGRFAAADGTVRYLLRLGDGETVEAVYLPDEIFDAEGRALRRRTTFCISTQAGCPVNCQFCMTARLGLKRSLTAGEIVGQVLRLMHEHGIAGGERLNLVYMGMGEPFLNYAAVMQSVRVLTHGTGAGLSPRRITISTSGIVDKIARFGAEPNRPRLAISLNATTDELRQRLMPLNRAQGGLAALAAAARAFPLGPRERLTWEYVLLAGVNDSLADAKRLAALSAGLRAKVNLIAWNAGPEIPFAPPSPDAVAAFQRQLRASGLPAYVRRPRGREVYAACGQLSRQGGATE
jgi:23S rRNA (adenine2503-C2)-methyltransferase